MLLSFEFLQQVLLFEDDIRFEPFFIEKLKHLVFEANDLVEWELIYLGRKKLKSSDEPWVSKKYSSTVSQYY